MANQHIDKKRNKWLDKSFRKAVFIFVICLISFQLFKFFPAFYELYRWTYFKIISPLFITVNTHFSFLYVIFLAIILFKVGKLIFKSSLNTAIKGFVKGTLNVLSAFLVLWGFHYSQKDLSVNPMEASQEYLFSETFNYVEERILDLDYEELYAYELSDEIRGELNLDLMRVTHEFFPEVKNLPKPRKALWSGMLRKLGIGGVFFPFTHEPLYDDSSPLVVKVFTYTHEYFHGIGVTGEDECNALAFYTLNSSRNKFFNFSGQLDLLRTSANAIGHSRESLLEITGNNTDELLNFIWKDNANYSSWFHRVSSYSNDIYLKSLGNDDGVLSYNSYSKFLVKKGEELVIYAE